MLTQTKGDIMYYWLKNLLHTIFIGKPRAPKTGWRFSLSEEGHEGLKDLVKKCQAESGLEVIDMALTLFQKQIAMKELGAKVGYWYEDEEGERIYHEFRNALFNKVKAK